MTTRKIRESTGAATATGDRSLRVTIITPGEGSSGIYPVAAIESAATDKVFAAGTKCYIDHPTESEAYERPERSVADLAGVLTSDATWDEDAQALVAEAKLFGHYAYLGEMADSIGMSIRASAEVEEARSGGKPTIRRFVAAESVDFVTTAGRGGFFTVMESARPEAITKRAVVHGVSEATANDTREALSGALRAAHPYPEADGEYVYTWVRDFDASTVWFELETNDGAGVYAQPYTIDDASAVTLSGTATGVRAQTTYVPVAAAGPTPDPTPTPTTESRRTPRMAQIDDAELRTLRESAAAAQTREAELAEARRERDEAIAAARVTEARTTSVATARTVAGEVLAESQLLPALARTAVLEATVAAAPIGEDGTLDEAAFRTAVEAARTAREEEIAEVLEANGVGRPRNLGSTSSVEEADTDAIEAEIRESRRRSYNRPATEKKD